MTAGVYTEEPILPIDIAEETEMRGALELLIQREVL